MRTDGREHVHRPRAEGWRIELPREEGGDVELGAGAAIDVAADLARSASDGSRSGSRRSFAPLALPFRRSLGSDHYRRSEESWDDAGRPTADVTLERAGDRLRLRVDLPRAERRFVAVDAENNLLIVHGAVPGAPGNYVIVRKAITRKPEPQKQAEKPGKTFVKKPAKK